METRTQLEIAGITVAIALSTGTYHIGKSASDDTVRQLENSLSSYQQLDKLNTEEFIDTAIATTNELKLSITERKKLDQMENALSQLEAELEKKQSNIKNLMSSLDNIKKEKDTLAQTHKVQIENIESSNSQLLSEKDNDISALKRRLEIYESPSYRFSLPEGHGTNLKKGTIQVGVSKIAVNNVCLVSVNNEKREMVAGEYATFDKCRVTLTECNYFSSSKNASFEMICIE